MPTNLSPLERVFRASAGRKSRLHTMRGELVSPRGIAELPWLVGSRLVGREPDGPWINAPALRHLRSIVQPTWRVFEFGSGRSTVWYATHAASVTALECLPDWHAEVTQRLEPYVNATVELVPARDFVERIGREPDESFDLVVVDGADQDEHGLDLPSELDRTGCVVAAREKVRPGGVLMLDNSDRPRYRSVESTLLDWASLRISGFPSTPLTPTETSFYRRPVTPSAAC